MSIALSTPAPALAGPAPATAAVEAFDPSQVRIHSGRYEAAQRAGGAYLLSLDLDRLLAPMRREAGLDQPEDADGNPAKPYPNWESTGLDGHVAGHALSAFVAFAQATGMPVYVQRAAALVRGMRACQERFAGAMAGFVGGVPGAAAVFEPIARGEVRAQPFALNDAWVPLYNLHKTFAGLLDAWDGLASVDPATAATARDCVLDLANWWCRLVATVDDTTFAQLLRCEFGGLCESFAELYARTGNERYLDMARRLEDHAVFDALALGFDELTGMHANTQVPKALGWQRIAALDGDPDCATAVATFWHSVAQERSVSIGAHSVGEHFHPVDDFSTMVTSVEGPETCNSYNMAKLTERLWLADPRAEYLDFYERITANHLLSTVHVDDPGFVYFTPMRPRHYRVYSSSQESFWCCVGSGLENHARYGRLIYGRQDLPGGPRLLVNLFVGSSLCWNEGGLVVKQRVERTADGVLLATVALSSGPGARDDLRLGVREPGWASAWQVERVDGGILEPDGDEGLPEGFHALRATWEGTMEFTLRLVPKAVLERLPDGSDWAGVTVGATVMALRERYGERDGERADDSRMGHIAHGTQLPFADLPVLLGDRPVVPDGDGALVEAMLPDGSVERLRLEPFTAMDGSRYSVYLPIAHDAQDVARVRGQLERLDEEERARVMGLLDEVRCGSQQSEIDHGYRGRADHCGMQDGVRWRSTQLCGVFSYLLAARHDGCVLEVELMADDAANDYAVFMGDVALERTNRRNAGEGRIVDAYAVPPQPAVEGRDTGETSPGPVRFSVSATATVCGPRVTAVRTVEA